MIQSAIEQQNDGIVTGYQVTMDDGKVLSVPAAEGNRHYQELMEWVAEGNTIEPYVAPPVPVPSQVSMRQARLALLQNGLLSQVQSAIDSMPSPQKEAAQIEWEYALDVERQSTLTQTLAQSLGLDETGLDNLFSLAATK